jgi:hypothetical protein
VRPSLLRVQARRARCSHQADACRAGAPPRKRDGGLPDACNLQSRPGRHRAAPGALHSPAARRPRRARGRAGPPPAPAQAPAAPAARAATHLGHGVRPFASAAGEQPQQATHKLRRFPCYSQPCLHPLARRYLALRKASAWPGRQLAAAAAAHPWLGSARPYSETNNRLLERPFPS